jgi:hypothetical protein
MFTRIAAILRVAGEASDLASLSLQEIVRIWYIFALLEDCQLPGLLLILPFVMQSKDRFVEHTGTQKHLLDFF